MGRGWLDAEPAAFDTSIAHHARIYDYLLGGKDNYAADRKAGDALKAAYPSGPHGIMDAVPAGSYLAISHPASDVEPDKVADLQTRVNQLSYQQYTGRSHDQVMRFFTGLELVEPGLVQVQQWRPGAQANGTLALWAGVGRKP